MAGLDKWLEDKHWILQFPNSVFRGMGGAIFLNNPISGALILAGILVNSPWVAVNALIGQITAVLTSVLLCQGKGAIISGLVTFHGFLIGIAIPTFVDKPAWYPWIVFPVIVMSIIR